MAGPFSIRHITIHGHDVGYRMAGDGPAVVLVHGMAGSSTTWRKVMPALADRYTVIAPDLLGHGESAKPRGDYSLGAHADGVRDLLVALGVERATFVGHSLGGGVAMQFAYQFPSTFSRPPSRRRSTRPSSATPWSGRQARRPEAGVRALPSAVFR